MDFIGEVKVSTYKLRGYLDFLIDLRHLLLNLEVFDPYKFHEQLLELKYNERKNKIYQIVSPHDLRVL